MGDSPAEPEHRREEADDRADSGPDGNVHGDVTQQAEQSAY